MNKIINLINWLAVGLAIIGAIYNSFGDVFTSSSIWIITNSFFVFNNIRLKNYAQSSLFAFYVLISLNGVVQNI